MRRQAPVSPLDTHRTCAFSDNALVQTLVGPHNDNLNLLERRLGVTLHLHGNAIAIDGPDASAALAESILRRLYARAEAGNDIDPGDVDAAVRMSAGAAGPAGEPTAATIRTRKRHIAARSPMQAAYLEALQNHDLVFALGPAGTGKTYLAVAQAVAMKLAGTVDRIVLSRPAVEAGERLGFLPGDMREKVDPYLRPLYDALYDMMPGDQVARQLEAGDIEVAPLAFMRGRTLANAFVILDEAQNTSPVQMKMFLTRLGENSRMVVTGDLSQIDLPKGAPSGLADALAVLEGVRGVARITFGPRDVVRHDLVTRIVTAYDTRDAARAAATPD
ncbi:MAG: PhoH family protein [Rhodospirillaceae bacterium]|nr:PhoH family protein [Rhodospirillaceae bacterium]